MREPDPGAEANPPGTRPLPPDAAFEPTTGAGPAPSVRLFAGVWPTPEVVGVLAGLPRPPVHGVRWTTPAQWHVTVAFLGAVPEPAIGALGTALVDAFTTWATGPVDARLGPTTERLGRSVLCVPATGLDALAARARAALAPVLPSPQPGPVLFRGHLTLARAHRRHTMPASLAGTRVAVRWRVDALSLVRSELDPAGARYTTLAAATVPR